MAVLKEAGVEASSADPSLFTLKRGTTRAFLLIAVNGGVIVGRREDIGAIVSALETFEIRRLGAARCFLGIEIERNRAARTMALSQARYVKTIVERPRMQAATPEATPMPVVQFLQRDDVSAPADAISAALRSM